MSNCKNNAKRKSNFEKYDTNTLNWINTEGGDRKFREKVVKTNIRHNVNLTVLEPGVFDFGVKRVGCKRDDYRVVYDVEKLAVALAESYVKWNDDPRNENRIDDYDFESAVSDAFEWIDFNTNRSLFAMGEYAPKLVIDDENGREKQY